ncbi:TonB-linked SusC/RagA family outer membrane protein [Mucilaginibacter gracilis]|uniref:TonB-linked SusC/RagA family outer membrane protein n=1 Tax=Mucilaginibacter gracilis TaxID=423350 RepID=A0A495IXD3_9SPHI|nr:SusC/RagA family TonB-linked outer membrane protein [Mucilaginibacter gracilis]RKR81367.1 TonB-linked SusC/RagA family outer membrane protein [Mucilaginibacter gracilis]
MKKLLLVSLCFLFYSMQIFAQNRTVTGTVTAKDDGGPMPGVSIKGVGTDVGVVTGADGKFSISLPATVKALQFSFIGYGTVTKSITGAVLNIELESSSKVLGEVLVTGAFGIKQTSRSASSAAQVVSGDDLNTVRQANINNALAGKVAGIQVRSQSTAALGRGTEVRLRGASGFGTGSPALYVVDGTIMTNSDDINPDDIESSTILEGAAAGALYGSQGASGVIVITLKKAKKKDGLNVDLNLGSRWDMAYILPNYQNTYAGGNNPDLTQYNWKAGDPTAWQALSGKYYPDYSDDSSWGPKMVGQEYIPWYAWYPGTQYSFKTATLNPQPNNARDYFNTGVTLNNNIAIGKATDDYNIRFSYGNQYIQGLVPNSDLRKNTMTLTYNLNLNKHFILGANINYVNQKQDGLVNDAYSNQTSGSFNQWFHRDIDMGIMKELRGLKSPTGAYASWNHADPNTYDPNNANAFYAGNYWYNFYTYQDLVQNVNQRDRLYGNISLTYKVNNDLSFKGTYRKMQNTTFGYTQFSSDLATSGVQTTGNEARNKGYYANYTTYLNRENYEFLTNYTKKIKDFKIDANAGGDFYNANYNDDSANTNNGLSVPNVFTISNSVDPASYGNTRAKERYNALFVTANIGWKDMLYLNGSLRDDWYSTLNPSKNLVTSKSIGGSFVFSELLKSQSTWLSMGKLRASYGEIPSALGQNGSVFGSSSESFGFGRYPGSVYTTSANKFVSNLLQTANDGIVDPNLIGNTVKEKELGIDLAFFNERLGLTATYWDGSNENLAGSVGLNGASGLTSITTNFGKITKNGLDFTLYGTPVKIKNFEWRINATYSNLLHDYVDEISNKYGIKTIAVGFNTYSALPGLYQVQGQSWGQIYGNGILRNANGVPILTSAGMYQNNPAVSFGSALPKHTGGIQNSFIVYKDFAINVNIDYQFGGKFSSLSDLWGSYSGLTARTAALNDKGIPVRDPVGNGGGIHQIGVSASGATIDMYVPAYDYYQNNYNSKTGDEFVYDLTFIKLRELGISYRIPVKKLGIASYVKNATFQLTGTDLWLLYAKTKDFDPSQISAVSGESGQLPGTRGIGFNLKVGF